MILKNKFMLRAIELSISSANGSGGPFGSVIVKDIFHILIFYLICFLVPNLSGCDLYASCEPCPMCLSAIYWSHVDNIFYANTREDAKKINFDDSLIYSEILL